MELIAAYIIACTNLSLSSWSPQQNLDGKTKCIQRVTSCASRIGEEEDNKIISNYRSRLLKECSKEVHL